ncbi:MAG: class II fructose-bisphosphate aldolase [Clostridia bacterium]|nr:class II fructose-bisphosphate aldolase [Clostridia bacterium]
MLVTSKEMFKIAQEKQFAIPSANFIDLESLRWHVEVAEKLGYPLILSLAEAHIGENITLEDAALVGKKYAEEASVPVVLHLDHGTTPELIKRSIDLGFTSVMIDASMEDFDENVRRTKDIVHYAHSHGVVVEAEIGHVGVGHNIGVAESATADDSSYTSVESAVEFCKCTDVDSLAISIGTAHGLYKGIPKINFERLAEIASAIDTPLVLHGGSSSGDENLNKCAKGGITKVNIYTDFLVAAKNEIDEGNPDNYLALKKLAKAGMQKCLEHYYKVFDTQKI